MKRIQAALALALLGAVSALCLKGMQKIGALLEQDAEANDQSAASEETDKA